MSDERQTDLDSERDQGNQKTFEERLKLAEERADKFESTNKRLLEQSQEWKTKAQKANENEADRLKQIQDEKEQELIAKGEFKKLLDQSRNENATLKQEKEDALKEKRESDNILLESRKLSAFENRLGGKLENDEYLTFVDTKNIIIDPDTGNIDVSSVDSTVKNFLGKHKSLVKFSKGKFPNFEGDKGNPVNKKRWDGMGLKDKKDNLKDAVDNYKKSRN